MNSFLPSDGFGHISVDGLVIDPTTPSTLYAFTDEPGASAASVFRSTNSGDSWSDVTSDHFLYVTALAIDPITPSTLYAVARVDGVFRSTDSGASWSALNTGLNQTSPYSYYVTALAIDPKTPSNIYAGTGAGVFAIQQVAICTGDCDGQGSVTTDEIITLVNVALGNAQAEACPHGVPSGAEVNVALIIQAVNSALSGCSG